MIDFSELSDYSQTATEISKNDSGTPLVNCNLTLINLDKYKDNKGLQAKSVDAIKIKNNLHGDMLFLIEFKGGRDPKDWESNTLELKAMDTLFCILPHEFGLDSMLDLMKSWKVIYMVICSNDNIHLSRYSNNSKIQKRLKGLASYHEKIHFNLQKYLERRPFTNIITESSDQFENFLYKYLE